MKIAVLGSGSWGTALALVAAGNGHEVHLWSRRAELAERLASERHNAEYLRDVYFPENLLPTSSLAEALDGAKIVLFVVPSQSTRSLWREVLPLADPGAVYVSATKGIENGSLMRMSEVAREEAKDRFEPRFVALSGPSFAREVAQGDPTAIVAVSRDEDAAVMVQRELSSRTFRIYTNDDLVGVELGGALKNVMAIATGGVAGLGLGHNTVAAIITRGLAEMTRLAVAMGGRVETLAGLAGLGDLVLTCTGGLSRNRFVGVELGRGRSLGEILDSMHEVAEGVYTTRAARELGLTMNVDLPITEAVHTLLFEGGNPHEMAESLMIRPLKRE